MRGRDALTSEEELRVIEKRSRGFMVDLQHSFVPSTFSPDENSFLYPSPKRPWSSLKNTIRSFEPRTVLTFLPHLLQLNQGVFWTLRDARLPEISMSPGNPQAALAIVRGLGTEGIVTDLSGAQSLQQTGPDSLSTILFWHIILPALAPAARFSARSGVACHDLHLFPGVSVAYQCKPLGGSMSVLYHPSAEFAWEESAGTLYASSTDERLVPIEHFSVSKGRSFQQHCTCGNGEVLEFHE